MDSTPSRINDLADSNKMNEVNEMKMIEKDDVSEFKKYVMKNEMSENERRNKDMNESSDEKE
jgi:hypothetical protein